VALPGGIGTLDEVIETFALVHLKQYFGKIFLLNHDGFYEPLKQLLRHYVDTKMMSEETLAKVMFVQTADEILEALK
jgi:predicted Rossmann-fold nucleotide-binding protein